MSGVEHSANKETMPQVVAYKKLNAMENDKAKHWSRLLTRGGRIWRFDCNYGLAYSLGLIIARGQCVSRHVVRLGYVTEMH